MLTFVTIFLSGCAGLGAPLTTVDALPGNKFRISSESPLNSQISSTAAMEAAATQTCGGGYSVLSKKLVKGDLNTSVDSVEVVVHCNNAIVSKSLQSSGSQLAESAGSGSTQSSGSQLAESGGSGSTQSSGSQLAVWAGSGSTQSSGSQLTKNIELGSTQSSGPQLSKGGGSESIQSSRSKTLPTAQISKPTRVVKRGSYIVRLAQRRLNEFGYYTGRADGMLGVNTRHALRLFQADSDLEITGRLNPVTKKALRIP